MAIREKRFRAQLETRRFRQHGEGYCWPAILLAALASRGDKRWDQEKLAKRLKLTIDDGAEASQVDSFLRERNILRYAEADCSAKRLRLVLSKLPENADIIASVWDHRIRPEIAREDDPAEVHIVAPLRTYRKNDRWYIEFFDPDSIIGGIHSKRMDHWMDWWHDGPEVKRRKNRVISARELDDGAAQSFLVLGMSWREAQRIIGKPDGRG